MHYNTIMMTMITTAIAIKNDLSYWKKYAGICEVEHVTLSEILHFLCLNKWSYLDTYCEQVGGRGKHYEMKEVSDTAHSRQKHWWFWLIPK
jgi:hypothetical protein